MICWLKQLQRSSLVRDSLAQWSRVWQPDCMSSNPGFATYNVTGQLVNSNVPQSHLCRMEKRVEPTSQCNTEYVVII